MPPSNRLAPVTQNAFGAPPTLTEIQLAARTAPRPSPMTLGQRAQELNYGLGRGFTNVLQGNLDLAQALYQDPRAVGMGFVDAARQLAQDPAGVVGNSLRGMWNRAKSSPAGLGEVVGENIDPRNWLKPRKAAMVKAAKPAGPYTAKTLPELYNDNPGGDWLEGKRADSDFYGTKPSGAPVVLGSVTATYKDKVYLPVSMLKDIPGENMEQSSVRPKSLDWLTKEMSSKNSLPTFESSGVQRENTPLVTIDQRGRPFITEGNHRIMVANKLGWEWLPVEVRYFNGGELEDGPLHPDRLAQFARKSKK